jgi:hypothetical protein
MFRCLGIPVALVGLSLATLLSAPPVRAETAGKVAVVSGKVLIRNEAGGQMRFAKVGDTLGKGDIINTSSTSSCKLLMTDKTVLDLGPSTLFKVDEYKLKAGADRNVGYSMEYGQLKASVNVKVGDKGRFTIKTNGATMGVRGTKFGVVSKLVDRVGQAASTQVVVFHGKVNTQIAGADGKAQSLTLGKGDAVTATHSPVRTDGRALATAAGGSAQGGTIERQKMDDHTLAKTESAISQKDNTFSAAVTYEPSSGSSSGKSEGSGGGGTPAAASQTLAAIAQAVNTQTAEIKIETNISSLPGVLNAADSTLQQTTNLSNLPANVRVILRR